MSWDAIAAVGQVVSALALVLVLLQLRHAREEMQRSAVLTRLEGTRDLFFVQATDEGLVSALARAQMAAGVPFTPVAQYLLDLGLSHQEMGRLLSFQSAIWHNFEASIESMKHLSPGVRQEVDNAIKNAYSQFIGAKWFQSRKAGLNPDAVRYVDNLLAEPG